MSLDLDVTESKRMCYPSNFFNFDTVNGHTSSRIASQDTMTYSHYVRGSILSVPKSWQVDNSENFVVSIYLFLKTFLR